MLVRTPRLGGRPQTCSGFVTVAFPSGTSPHHAALPPDPLALAWWVLPGRMPALNLQVAEMTSAPSFPTDWAPFLEGALWTVPFLLAAAFFSVLRSALLHSHVQRVVSR